MKTKQEIECMKQKLSQKIETLGEKSGNTPYGSSEWLCLTESMQSVLLSITSC